MLYHIRLDTEAQAQLVLHALENKLAQSRFTVRLETRAAPRRRVDINLWSIRLREKKDNCGNHPGPCQLTWKPHKHTRTLEGLDWVSFNDGINDLLDQLGLAADVASTTCKIREGTKRRVAYRMRVIHGHADWDPTGLYFDWLDNRLGEPKQSRFPAGTPGRLGWGMDATEPSPAQAQHLEVA